MSLGVNTKVHLGQDRVSEENRDRFFGEYVGFVKDRADPKQLGRVRVLCPQIIGDGNGTDSLLDWAFPKGAAVAVPPVGEEVSITFELGMVQYPLYTWGRKSSQTSVPPAARGAADPTWLAQATGDSGGFGSFKITATLPADGAKTVPPVYPYNKVFQSESGHILELDDSPSNPRARYYHPKGTTILIDADGSVHVRSKGAQHFHSGGDVNFLMKENATFRVVYPGGAALAVGANGIHLNGHQLTLLGRVLNRDVKAI